MSKEQRKTAQVAPATPVRMMHGSSPSMESVTNHNNDGASSLSSFPRLASENGTGNHWQSGMAPVHKRGLVIQKTTEDLLKGSKLLTTTKSSPVMQAHETSTATGREKLVHAKRSVRLSKANLDSLHAKVQLKEQKRQISLGSNVCNIMFLFVGLFCGFGGTAIGLGYGINNVIGPAWTFLQLPEQELASRIFLDDVSVESLWESFLQINADSAHAIISDLTKINCVLFSIVVQVTTILVQVGVKEFSANAIQIFVADRVLVGIIIFYTLTLGYMVMLTNLTSDQYIPRGEIAIGSIFTIGCVLALIPYFVYLSRLLNPLKIVRKVAETGLKSCTFREQEEKAGDRKIKRDRDQAIWCVENITQFGINAMKNQRPVLAYTCVEVLSHFLIGYGCDKHRWGEEWFKITEDERDTPDFFSLSDDGVQDLQNRRCWLEWKVLRQYQNLFTDALNTMKDVAYVLAVNTRRIGEASSLRHDYHAFEYCVRFFNTFIRYGISQRDGATVHNILHQYRLLCTSVLSQDQELLKLVQKRKQKAALEEGLEFFQVDDLIQIRGNYVVEEARDIIIAMEKKIISMAQYLVYYSSVAIQSNAFFVSETIAHELALLCQSAFLNGRECHEELLLTFLMQHEASVEKGLHQVTWAIRAAQIKLATFYAKNGAMEYFHCIQTTFKEEPREDLVKAWRKLERVHDREFWEVNDRGTNMEYVCPEQKALLPSFFGDLGVTTDDLHFARNYNLGQGDDFDFDSFPVIEEEPSGYRSSFISPAVAQTMHQFAAIASVANNIRAFRSEASSSAGNQEMHEEIDTEEDSDESAPSTNRDRRRSSGIGATITPRGRRRSSAQVMNDMLLKRNGPVWSGSEAARTAADSLHTYRRSTILKNKPEGLSKAATLGIGKLEIQPNNPIDEEEESNAHKHSSDKRKSI